MSQGQKLVINTRSILAMDQGVRRHKARIYAILLELDVSGQYIIRLGIINLQG
jgi:hypothetical protein